MGSEVIFDGTRSFDPDGFPLTSYAWTFGDGGAGSDAQPAHTYTSAGEFEISLVVTDTDGATSPPATASVTIQEPSSTEWVLVGAGDVAGCDSDGDEATARLLDAIPGTVFTAGDNAYPSGTMTDFRNCYRRSWGRHLGRTRPTAGNHDYNGQGAADYFAYFGSAAGPEPEGYYSYDLGAWHVVALNSNINHMAGSPQLQWLEADLAASNAQCTVAYWHHPRFSSGLGGSVDSVDPFWRALHAAGADIVIVGHDHDYERFTPLDADGTSDPSNGIRQFVVGSGGINLFGYPSILSTSEFRYDADFGVLKLMLYDGGYDWEFISASRFTIDEGSGTCR